jgi:hypothetical protein
MVELRATKIEIFAPLTGRIEAAFVDRPQRLSHLLHRLGGHVEKFGGLGGLRDVAKTVHRSKQWPLQNNLRLSET